MRMKKLAPFDAMAIYIRRENTLRAEYACGDNVRLFSSLEIPIGQGLSGWVAENRKPIVNGNPAVEPGYLDDPTRFSTMRSALAAPLESVQGVIGVIALYREEKDAFERDHLRIVQAVSSKLAFAIENALRYRQAESSAATDFLTQLPNARSLFLHLEGELARCRRLDNPLIVLVTDLDGFKQVNDRFGHLEGNRLLKLVASSFRECCREYDYVARMGGDEFIVVLPGVTPDTMKTTIQRLSDLTVLAGREVCGEPIVSLSIGFAHYPDDGATAEELLAEADRRMYAVKQYSKLERSRGFAFERQRIVGAD
jgi:diguanylate cyclase (GGDEF)-like protein